MKKLFLTAILLLPLMVAAQPPAKIIKLKDLQNLMTSKSDSIQVINFWATWCGPCVKELPLFEKLNNNGTSNVKVSLVSLDLDLDPNPEKVYKFVTRKNLKSEVLILDEQDPNSWIDKIDPRWSGALPATLIVNTKTGKRTFFEGEVDEEKLNNLITAIQ
ncbi:MAG TPA: TlpA disulfide reductase family protein [Chryseosolibacter sp.]|nr:TlpA disulfide reductase family protein [Chryseosolibacter sp.]